MPIYEYQCRECDHRLEKLQKLSDPPLTECPSCGRPSLAKLVSAAGFRLKGGGWYETDFKKDGKRNLAGDDAGKSESKSDKTESKPDAKPDTKSGSDSAAKSGNASGGTATKSSTKSSGPAAAA